MGIIRLGAFSGFRNKVGNLVGAAWRNLDVIKGMPRKSSKPPTQLQLNQQNKFRLITTFLSWISGLIEAGFKSANGNTSPMNAAVAYHLKNAITGVAPNFAVDYTKVVISRGKLELPANPEVETTVAGKIKYTWLHGVPDDKFVDATDKATLLVYNPVKDRFVSLRNAAARSALTFDLLVPGDFSGDTVHCYLSFNSVKKRDLVSNSIYLGTVPVI